MINWFNHMYPYTNFHELNLDWVIATVRHGEAEIANFIGVNTIKYANPILWNIESQYEANTVVVDAQTGNAYISTKPVPSGVHLSRTDYWTQIYNYADVVDTLREQIASNESESTTATKPYNVDALVFVNGDLYRVTHYMIAGDSFVVDSNCVKTTVEAEIARVRTAIELLADKVGDLTDLSTEDKTSIVNAINEVLTTITTTVGDLTDLDTEDKTNIVNAINEALTTITTTVGDLADLDTEDKTSVVNAINEVLTTITTTVGDLADLNTDDKSSIVNAINEVLTKIGQVTFGNTRFNIVNSMPDTTEDDSLYNVNDTVSDEITLPQYSYTDKCLNAINRMAEDTPNNIIEIATYNVENEDNVYHNLLNGYNKMEAIRKAFIDIGSDIICSQEQITGTLFDAKKLMKSYLYKNVDCLNQEQLGDLLYQTLLTASHITPTSKTFVRFTSQPSGGNGGYYKTIYSINNKLVAVYNVHIYYVSGSIQTAQINELFSAFNSDTIPYRIIMGDLNVDLGTSTLYNVFTNAGYIMLNSGQYITYPDNNIAVDGGIITSNITILDREVLDNYPSINSDHLPFKCRLRLN